MGAGGLTREQRRAEWVRQIVTALRRNELEAGNLERALRSRPAKRRCLLHALLGE